MNVTPRCTLATMQITPEPGRLEGDGREEKRRNATGHPFRRRLHAGRSSRSRPRKLSAIDGLPPHLGGANSALYWRRWHNPSAPKTLRGAHFFAGIIGAPKLRGNPLNGLGLTLGEVRRGAARYTGVDRRGVVMGDC